MAIVLATLEPPPERLGVTHWSSRLLAAELGLSNVKVADVWREWGLQPWRAESFKFSTDPRLEAKVRDVTGLYLNPPDKAVVLCVDEKPQTQALERKAPVLPMRPGIPEKRSHDYIRHGTTALFAALEAATGKVTGACYPRHRHEEFLHFLKQVARAYPRVPLHIVCDVRRVADAHLDPGLGQRMIDRPPVHARAFHRRVRDAQPGQPGRQLAQRPPEGLEPLRRHGALAGPLAGQPDRHPDDLLVHVDPGDPRMDDLHRQPPYLPPILDTGAPPAEPATRSRSCETRSQQQSGVPTGRAPASV